MYAGPYSSRVCVCVCVCVLYHLRMYILTLSHVLRLWAVIGAR